MHALLGLVIVAFRFPRESTADSVEIVQVIEQSYLPSPSDEDNDGLSFTAEVILGTDPFNPDTDEDGLDDGDEQIWGTDPLNPDSDGDGLKDGDEVYITGTSPMNEDTDGDGTFDGVDPDPGSVPTPTEEYTITPSPTNTPTVTPTITPSPTSTPTETPTNTPSPTNTPTNTPTTTPSPTSIPIPQTRMLVEAEWPQRMEIDRSDSIRISLIRSSDQSYIATVRKPAHTAVVATIIPIDSTPGAPIELAYGTAYEACAIADLKGALFEIFPVSTGPECQPLDKPQLIWEWSITHREGGKGEEIIARIEAHWTPTNGGRTIQRDIWIDRFIIDVESPIIKTDQINVLSLFSGLAGSALSTPWLYSRVKEIIERRRREEQEKPKILLP
jgi:hypothetical protein